MNDLTGWSFWWTVAVCTVAAIDFMSLVFLVAWKQKRIDLVDSFWGPTFIVVALVAAYLSGPLSAGGWIITALVVIWGTRLWWHIFRRYLASSKQDPRYTELSSKWPARRKWLQVYLRVYIVQALLALVISMPVIAVLHGGGSSSSLWLVLGVAVWLVGFVCEATADRQLAGFISDKNNRGKLMTTGLWRYSRHPNYFGEVTQWWGIWLAAVGTHYAAVAVVGPLLITYLIVFVSGLPPAEARMSRKPGWDDYKKRTGILLPLPSGKSERR